MPNMARGKDVETCIINAFYPSELARDNSPKVSSLGLAQ